MSHTKGPWTIQRHDKGDSRRLLVVGKSGMVADIDWNTPSENEANGRLIIAAPKLLHELQCLLDFAESRIDSMDYDFDAFREVINQAEGGGT